MFHRLSPCARLSQHLLLACLTLSAPLAIAQDADQSAEKKKSESNASRRFYSISINDNVIGYNMIDRVRVEVDGRPLLRIDSETSMKFALLGKQRSTLSKSTTLLDPKTNQVISYDCVDKTNDTETYYESRVVDGAIEARKFGDKNDKGDPSHFQPDEPAPFLGSNNFAHWELLIVAANKGANDKGEANIQIFIPEAMTLTKFPLERKPEKTLKVGKKSYACQLWRFKGAGIDIAVDKKSGRLVRMRLPGQEALIEVADESIVKQAQKARAEEVLAKLFVQSNVVFDDFLKVSEMNAKADITVFGVVNDDSILQTAMQKFDGEKDDQGRVQGVFHIKSVRYEGEDAPVFPTEDLDEDLVEWTKPSPLIESDHDAIAKQSAELTKDAKDRWDAVKRVGDWVHNEIAYTIADSPSAKLCLETRKGDCGPHSTLTIAMLRSAGIPARLVGGVVFTPSFGGSFGQHAWVEVHMGDAGWIAIDPTTDEFEQISATHIKLFEGVGGVRSKSIEVQSYKPPNKSDGAFQFTDARPLKWRLNTPYVFKYRKGDSSLGEEKFQIEEVEADGQKRLKLTSELNLKINLLSSLSSKTELTTMLNGKPVSMKRKLTALLQTTRIECEFQGDKVNAKVIGLTRLERDIDLPAGAFCFDNNLMGCWVLIGSQLPLKADKPVAIRTFHPSSLQLIPLTLHPKPPAKIKVGGKEVECFECDLPSIKNTFWFTTDGRFVRAQQGDLVIELADLDPPKAKESDEKK